MTSKFACQACGASLDLTWIDLGLSPVANDNVPPERAEEPDPSYPLHAFVCRECLLVQVPPVVPRDAIFNDSYAYFSSYSDSWLQHARSYVEEMTSRFGLGAASRVIEIASNDGYLLQYFVQRGVPVLGIEPSANVAEAARAKGVDTDVRFFGADTARSLAQRGFAADLLVAKNVMAHVPNINDFVAGVRIALRAEGVFTVEFPHLLNTIRYVQFDTIYHEHYTYLSLVAIERVFARHGLRIFDVEKWPTHGGSLRVFVCRKEASHVATANVERALAEERAAGLESPQCYAGFETKVRKVRDDLLAFLDDAKEAGQTVAAYGAAAKGNTLLNYCGIGREQVAIIADRSPAKQGMLAPGTHIPIVAPERLLAMRPDYVLILPWNLADEIKGQLESVRSWGGRFVTAIPELSVD
jgi:SAM-dependent methyltransferase